MKYQVTVEISLTPSDPNYKMTVGIYGLEVETTAPVTPELAILDDIMREIRKRSGGDK